MAAISICSDFGAQKNSLTLFPLFPHLFPMKWWDRMPSTNPLVDLELESFKKDPRQSLTPTHVTAARAVSRGHRRTPSDGALGQRGAPEPTGPGPGE